MKQMITIAIITFIFILLSVYSSYYLDTSANSLITHIDKIESYTKIQDWNKVNSELSNIEHIWSGLQDKWAILIEHEEIDKIEMSLSKITKYSETKTVSDCLAESSNLKLLLKHIPEMHTLNLKNVL